MQVLTGDHDEIRYLYRDPLFDRSLETLRKKGGYAAVAASKVDGFLALLMNGREASSREKFRFTRNGEARIKNCRKVDLGCGYRLICIKKDRELALLFVGTHDECLRWIHRHRGLKYETEGAVGPVQEIETTDVHADAGRVPSDVREEQRLLEDYEASLMSRLDDGTLRKIFSGLCEQRYKRCAGNCNAL